jgi:hypothetical protein
MKRFLIGGLFALALLAGTSAPAHAHGGYGYGFGVGVGVNFSWSAWAGCPTNCCQTPVEFIIPIVPHNDYIPMRPIGLNGH